jgi:LPS export ABC transporter permease LptF/LPS export ABC transporter permease LptG
MRILSRYILKELVGPTMIGFAFYTFIILMNQLFRLAEMIITRSLPLSDVLKLLGLSLPHIVVLTIPMALLFGILIAIGRLSSDSEIIAMRSVGISTTSIYRPVFVFSLLIFLLNLWLINFVTPWGNATKERLFVDIFTSTVEREIQPRVFYDDYPNRVIYVNDVTPEGLWSGVFISDSNHAGRQQVVVARTGRLTTDDDSRLWLDLQDAENHIVTAGSTTRYDRTRNATQRILLPDRYSQAKVVSYSKSAKSMDVWQLIKERSRLLRENPDSPDLRLTEIEIQKKFSIPFACLAFGVVALPLGISNRRGGKSSGFTLSLGVILVYYILLSNGEELARSGKIPAEIALWIPNIALVILGAWLIRRANIDAGRSSEASAIIIKLQELLQVLHLRIKRRRGEAGPSLLTRIDIPFPNTLDRYVLREFLKILFAIIVSVVVLQLVVDYSETAGYIAENQPTLHTVLSYYRYLSLASLDRTIPISILMGTLICFGLLAKNNEVTALKSIGVSLYRIALPVVLIAALFSGVSYLLLDYVLPYSNEKVATLRAEIRGTRVQRTFSAEQRQWLFGKGRYMFNFLNYDKASRTLSRVQVFEFDPVSFKLTRRIYADEARFDGTGWVFVDGWFRSLGPDGEASYTPIDSPIRLHYPERPEYFEADSKQPDQMTYAELSDHISDLETSGYSAAQLKVALYHKTAWPFVSLVMAVIALPFSFRIGKRGALYGVGIALFVAFVYYTVYSVFTKFGEIGNLPPLLSAWSANVLFVVAAIYLFLHSDT